MRGGVGDRGETAKDLVMSFIPTFRLVAENAGGVGEERVVGGVGEGCLKPNQVSIKDTTPEVPPGDSHSP